MSQALAHNPFEKTIQFFLPEGYGVLYGRLDSTNLLRLSTAPNSGLEWNSLLYPLNATMALSDGAWVIRADTLTFKAPPKGKARLLPLITQVVNAVMSRHGDLTEAVTAYTVRREYESLTRTLEKAKNDAAYHERCLMTYRTQQEKTQEALAALLQEHPELSTGTDET